MSLFYGGRVVCMLVVAALSVAGQSASQTRRRSAMPGTGEIESMANFALTVWRFSQADVDAQRVLLVPPESAPAQPLALQLRATLGPSGAEAAPPRTLRVRVREPAAAPPAFRQPNPVLRLDQVTKLDIGKQYFEIEGIDDDDPNLIFVVTEAPVSGSLLFVHDRKSAVNLHGGQEFYLRDFYNGSVQYRYHGDKSKMKDSFEVLATDGNFEISNHFTVEVFSKQNKNDVRREKISVNPLVSSVQFASESESILVFENTTLVRVPVHRTGDVSQEGFVGCFTSTENKGFSSATPGQDFEPRARGANSSLLIFHSGIKTVYCEIIIIDDDVYENEEEFSLNLELVPGNIISSLLNRTQLRITISDLDDKPTIQFDREYFTVSDNIYRFNPGIATSITINVLRTGDSSLQSRVHISTQDGSAVKGLDYEQFSTSLLFSPGDTLRAINISVLQGQRHNRQRRHDRAFYVVINPHDILGAVLGEASTVTVFIAPPDEGQRLKLFPSEPIILSFKNGDISNFTNVVSPGYPLVCISSCNKLHPLFNTTSKLCHLTGIEDSNNTYFSWEIAPPYKGTVSRVTTHLPFKELFESTVFADVHSKILDPSFFGENYKVRCATTPVEGNGLPPLGIPIKSQEILIGGKNVSRCPIRSTELELFNGEHIDDSSVFTTTMKYVSSSERNSDRRNKIHIKVEVPHNDGMLPLISTSPLSNIHSLLSSRHHSSEHTCSNLPPSGVFLNTVSDNIVNSSLLYSSEGNVTNLLYRHLNYTSCKWTFEGWFYLSQLIENCHGKISSQHQNCTNTVEKMLMIAIIRYDTRHDQSWVSVQVPLYIVLHHANGPAELHHTRLLVSFHYSTSLGHSLQQDYKQSDADIQKL
ncbi:LOW QUALITY PROTEIN: Extracellular matrix protein FRAS1 [Gryllus bimaculatus]|nr:LOW QUALITY PROTEIN: Extracellular matrix protein FRAS1 [Gryllus bimaculatus]